MSAWRFVEITDLELYRFQCLREALAISVGEGLSPNTMLFTQLLGEYVGIGKNASIKQMVHLDFCEANRLPVIRSISPSGTAGLSDSNTIRTITVVKKDPLVSNMDMARQRFFEAGVASLRSLGLEAEHIPKTNNIVVKGKKIAICNVYIYRSSILFPLGITVDFNYEKAEKTFVSAKNVREWVTTVKKELGREVSVDELRDAVKQGFQQTLGIIFEESDLSTQELDNIEELLPKYTSESWLKTGRWSPVKDYWRPE